MLRRKINFEIIILLLLILYCTFYFSPSSYGIALDIFGIANEGLFFGKPRGIRSDEWAVWTPYFQAAVNNEFRRYDIQNLYNIDFRNFFALPIFDWSIILKPFLWPFLFFQPARAYSIYYGMIAASSIIGWKRFFQKIFSSIKKSNLTFILFSFLLYYSSFHQMWWTTLGTLLATAPWLLIAIFSYKNSLIIYFLTVSYAAVIFLIGHTYPPLIISVAYFGFLSILLFLQDFFRKFK